MAGIKELNNYIFISSKLFCLDFFPSDQSIYNETKRRRFDSSLYETYVL